MFADKGFTFPSASAMGVMSSALGFRDNSNWPGSQSPQSPQSLLFPSQGFPVPRVCWEPPSQWCQGSCAPLPAPALPPPPPRLTAPPASLLPPGSLPAGRQRPPPLTITQSCPVPGDEVHTPPEASELPAAPCLRLQLLLAHPRPAPGPAQPQQPRVCPSPAPRPGPWPPCTAPHSPHSPAGPPTARRPALAGAQCGDSWGRATLPPASPSGSWRPGSCPHTTRAGFGKPRLRAAGGCVCGCECAL